MAGVQNTKEQKFKDWIISQLIELEPAQFMPLKESLVDPAMYPEGVKPLTKAEVDPKNKRELMELITTKYPKLEQSTVIVHNVFKKLGVNATFTGK